MSNDGTGLRERLEALATAMYADGDEWNAYDLLMDAAAALSAVAPPPVLEVDYRRVLQYIVDVMGPKVPPCCDGCEFEWGAALDAAKEALAASPAAPAQPEGEMVPLEDALRRAYEPDEYEDAFKGRPAQPEGGDWKAELHEALSEEYSDTRPAPAQTDGRPSDAAIARAFWDRWTSTAIHVEAAHELQRIHTAALASNAAASAADAQEGE